MKSWCKNCCTTRPLWKGAIYCIKTDILRYYLYYCYKITSGYDMYRYCWTGTTGHLKDPDSRNNTSSYHVMTKRSLSWFCWWLQRRLNWTRNLWLSAKIVTIIIITYFLFCSRFSISKCSNFWFIQIILLSYRKLQMIMCVCVCMFVCVCSCVYMCVCIINLVGSNVLLNFDSTISSYYPELFFITYS